MLFGTQFIHRQIHAAVRNGVLDGNDARGGSKQYEEYSNRFEFAVPPSLPTNDPSQPPANTSLQTGQPEYIYFKVQRTEVLEPKETDWKAISYGAALNDIAAWSNQSGVQDIVDPNYIFPEAKVKMGGSEYTTHITWPLPPLFLKTRKGSK